MSRSRLALVLLAAAWLWGYAHLGGVPLADRIHLFVGTTVAAVLALWPSNSGRGLTATGSKAAVSHWLALAVGLILYGGVAWGSIPQLPGWILAAVAWSTLIVVSRALDDEPRGMRWVLGGLLVMGLLQAGIGVYQGLEDQVVRGSLRNPNHFAGAMAATLGPAVALVWWSWRRGRRRWLLAALLVCGLLVSAIGLSGSRGGWATAALVLAFVYLRLRATCATGHGGHRRWPLGWRPMLVLGLGVGLAVAVTLWLRPRLEVDGLDRRLEVYLSSVEMIADHPWTGVGPGLYRWRYRPYQRFDTTKHFDHAHNDYLQAAAEWGLPASLLLSLFLAHRWSRAASAAGLSVADEETPSRGEMDDGGRAWDAAAALAVSAAMLAMAVHSLVDFGLQIPVLLMQLAALAALAGRFGKVGGRQGASSAAGSTASRSPAWGAAVAALLVTAVAGWAVVRTGTVAWAYAQVRDSTTPRALERALEAVAESPTLHFQLAMLRRDSDVHRQPKTAHHHLQEAIRLNPHSWRYRFELGRFYELVGRPQEAWTAYRQALRLNPWDGDYQGRIGGFLLRRGETTLGRALLAQAAVDDRRSLTDLGRLILGDGASPRELVAWWPKEPAYLNDLLALLCRWAEGTPGVDGETLLADIWRRWLEDGTDVSLEGGDFYIRHLQGQGLATEARRQWIRLARADPGIAAATVEPYAARQNFVWNGDFEAPLGSATFSWRFPAPPPGQAPWVAPYQGLEGQGLEDTVLLFDFDGKPKIDSKEFRQQLVVEPATVYELEYLASSEGLVPGFFLEVLDADERRGLFAGEVLADSTPWRSMKGRFVVPQGVERLILRLATLRGQRDVPKAGRLWLDDVVLRPLGGAQPEPDREKVEP